MTRQAKHNARLRAAGRCHCGKVARKSGRCARCYAAYRARMREYMAARRAAAG